MSRGVELVELAWCVEVSSQCRGLVSRCRGQGSGWRRALPRPRRRSRPAGRVREGSEKSRGHFLRRRRRRGSLEIWGDVGEIWGRCISAARLTRCRLARRGDGEARAVPAGGRESAVRPGGGAMRHCEKLEFFLPSTLNLGCAGHLHEALPPAARQLRTPCVTLPTSR